MVIPVSSLCFCVATSLPCHAHGCQQRGRESKEGHADNFVSRPEYGSHLPSIIKLVQSQSCDTSLTAEEAGKCSLPVWQGHGVQTHGTVSARHAQAEENVKR